MWNCHTSLPVMMSMRAQVAGRRKYASPVAEPRMSRFSKIFPGVFDWIRPIAGRVPPSPFTQVDDAVFAKVRMVLPVAASISWKVVAQC